MSQDPGPITLGSYHLLPKWQEHFYNLFLIHSLLSEGLPGTRIGVRSRGHEGGPAREAPAVTAQCGETVRERVGPSSRPLPLLGVHVCCLCLQLTLFSTVLLETWYCGKGHSGDTWSKVFVISWVFNIFVNPLLWGPLCLGSPV